MPAACVSSLAGLGGHIGLHKQLVQDLNTQEVVHHRIELNLLCRWGFRVSVALQQLRNTLWIQQTAGFDRFAAEMGCHQLIEFLQFLLIGMGWRGHEGKFLAVIQPLRQQPSHGCRQLGVKPTAAVRWGSSTGLAANIAPVTRALA